LQQTLDQVYEQMIPLSSNLLDVGRALAGLGALFFIANKVWKNFANAESIDYYPLLRPFAIGIIIIIYPFFIDMVNGVLSPITSATETMLDDNNKAIAVALAAKEKALEGTDEWRMYVGLDGEGDKDAWYRYTFKDDPSNQDMFDKAVTDIAFSVRQSIYKMKNSMRAYVSEVLNLLYNAAALCINTIRTFYLVVLVILGPLALGFSVFDGFTHTLSHWLGRYINIYLWLAVANIFGSILAKIQVNMINLDTAQLKAHGVTAFGPTDLAYLIFLIFGIVGYTTVPNVSQYIVHVTGTHSALQKITNIVAIAGQAATGQTAQAAAGVARATSGAISGALAEPGSTSGGSSSGGSSGGGGSYQQKKISG
jgi:conjugative transposon TraJ protein